jgi:8-oxo-dGTP diphosphatase
MSSPMKQVAAALITHNGQILICQRTKHQPMPLKWEFPGGKIEEGEQPRDAMRRELEEELGILAEIGEEVARIRHNYRTGNKVELRFFVVQRFEGELDNRIFRDVRWVRREQLPDYDFLEADRELVADIAAGKIL